MTEHDWLPTVASLGMLMCGPTCLCGHSFGPPQVTGAPGSALGVVHVSDPACTVGNPKPCALRSSVQFISRINEGTCRGTSNGATFEFDWTPRLADAANGNSALTGDHIYTSSVQLTPAASTGGPKPSITSNRVVNPASFGTTVAPNPWMNKPA